MDEIIYYKNKIKCNEKVPGWWREGVVEVFFNFLFLDHE